MSGTWDAEAKRLFTWFRQNLNHSAELSEWVTMELGDKLHTHTIERGRGASICTQIQGSVQFPLHLRPRRVHDGAKRRCGLTQSHPKL